MQDTKESIGVDWRDLADDAVVGIGMVRGMACAWRGAVSETGKASKRLDREAYSEAYKRLQ